MRDGDDVNGAPTPARRPRTLGAQSRAQTARIRDVVFARDEGRCVAGDTPGCSGPLTLQHRINRGMGGSAELDGPENLVAMCARHNALAESSPEFARLARVAGWKLPRGGQLFDVPVLLPGGRWFRLDAFGNREQVWP